MFRCTDCGQEFEIKPDYCDCGNDLFEEIVKPLPQPAQAFTPRPKVTRKPIDLPSLIIFFICIVLAILPWVFEDAEKQTSPTPSAPSKTVNIPSIDKLWKENVPTVKIADPKPVVVLPPKTPAKPKPVTSKPAVTPQQVVKQQPTTTKTRTPSMTEQQKQEIIKKLTTAKAQQPVKKVEETKPVQAEKKPEPPKVDYAAQKRELNAYKTALRNKLGGNINFAAVIGDGKCAITFKLDSSGNLINRAFSIQSSNDSLNDAVYAAMMQNPTFKAPPAGYKNETLTLSVQIYGGQFEVGLR